jgi:hypothetical protein
MTATNNYGRAGGPSVQQVREFMDMNVSSNTTTAQTTTFILQNAGAVTGDDTSYYLIWGYTVGHTASSVAYGYIESNEGTPENISAFAVTSDNTQTDSFPLPVRVAANKGVNIRTLNNPDGTVLASVKYTIITP